MDTLVKVSCLYLVHKMHSNFMLIYKHFWSYLEEKLNEYHSNCFVETLEKNVSSGIKWHI